MKHFIAALAFGTGLFSAGTALAGEQTVTLAVANMTCASCPYIVKQSLTAIPGVTNVAVSFQRRSATVSFDDRKTTADALIGATTKAGYPAKLAAAPSAAVTQ